MKRLAIAVAVLLCLVGCIDDTQPLPEPTGCIAQAPAQEPERSSDVDGDAAMSWLEQIVRTPGGQLRPRTPADPDHACTADWLAGALAADGWTVGRSDFTGAQALAIPGNPASGYLSRCDETDAAEVPAMALSNVWATYGEGRTVAIAAHWDAKEDSYDGGVVPAANDGASGMAVGLELQRAIAAAGTQFPFQVMVLFIDAEDGFDDCHALLGSHHFASTMPHPVERLILLDMVGDATALFPREGRSVESDPGLVDLVWAKAAEHGMDDHFIETQKSVLDDHLPFIAAGVPSIDIIDYARPGSSFPPYWHTTGDDVDKMSPDMLGDMASLLLDVLADPAFVETWA